LSSELGNKPNAPSGDSWGGVWSIPQRDPMADADADADDAGLPDHDPGSVIDKKTC
jgi:hypothetical protein